MELCERITDGDQLPLGLKPAVKKNLASFVGVIRKLRRAAQSVSLRYRSEPRADG
jgi:DNA helicase-2/ATP-dependent DNA helicase PcrA